MVLRPRKFLEDPSEVQYPAADDDTMDEKPTGQSITTAKDSEDKN
jgi:hypothetical protein